MKKGNISIFVPHSGCPQKCSFCNQNTITGHDVAPSANDVANAVETALKTEGYEFEIAFFGGSFTAIDRDYMISLLEAAKPYVESGAVTGIRCSTRPDCVDEETLDILKEYGVTAIELGAQSMDDGVLIKNLRGHTAEDVRSASRLVKKYGFELGLQMMTGLYGSTRELDIYSAREIISLEPKTVRIYPTVVLKNTYLARLLESGKYVPDTLEGTVSLCARLVPMFEERNIKIIRLGLHSSDDVKENMLGGGYHESLGELVQSRILLNKILENPAWEYTVYINKKTLSKLKGNKKANITALENAGYRIEILFDDSLNANELRLENGIKNS
ncbi:MAG: radical SAM protein [Eubacterium sp.]|nr:radical SAM protein [Eubacterium sp.]